MIKISYRKSACRTLIPKLRSQLQHILYQHLRKRRSELFDKSQRWCDFSVMSSFLERHNFTRTVIHQDDDDENTCITSSATNTYILPCIFSPLPNFISSQNHLFILNARGSIRRGRCRSCSPILPNGASQGLSLIHI